MTKAISRLVYFLLLGFVLILLQGLLRQLLPHALAAYVPNLVLLVVLYLALFEIGVAGALTSFFLGLLLDVSSGLLLGPWAGACIFLFAGVSSVAKRIYADSTLVVMLAGATGSLLASCLYWILLSYVPGPMQLRSLWDGAVTNLLVQVVVAGMFAPSIFSFVKRMLRYLPDGEITVASSNDLLGYSVRRSR